MSCYYTKIASLLGTLTLASDGERLIGLWLDGQKYFLEGLAEKPVRGDQLKIFGAAREWLARYFAGEKPQIRELPLAPAGSDFRQKVWEILCEIPYGQCMTYGEIAREMALIRQKKTMSAQAVGGAVAHNPISIVIPCHRVVGTNGSLTGYAGGLDKKIRLLQLEGVDMQGLFVPAGQGTACRRFPAG